MDRTSPPQDVELRWIKASKSVGSNACVELAGAAGAILMRDSKRPKDPPMRYTAEEIDAFIDGAKKGEFDELVRSVKVQGHEMPSPLSASLARGGKMGNGWSLVLIILLLGLAIGLVAGILSFAGGLSVFVSILAGGGALATTVAVAVGLATIGNNRRD